MRPLDAAGRAQYSEHDMPIPLLLHGRHAPPTAAASAGHAEPTVQYEPFGPWLVPWRFGSLEEEYAALRRKAALVDYSTQAVIEVQGAGRADLLHRLLTNDIKTLSPGRGCRAALLTASAKLVSDLLVLAEDRTHWLLCDLPQAAVVVDTLNRYVFSEPVRFLNHERRWAALALQGPRAAAILARLCGTPVDLPHAADHVRLTLAGLSVWIIRYAPAGDPGVVCLVDAGDAEPLWQLLASHAAPAGWDAFNAARIEAGLPWFGIDMDDSNLLPETGLERSAVSDTKGCYLGQEIVARLAAYGSVSRKLVGLVCEGTVVPQPGDAIRHAGEDVGRITSACRSPALGRPVALGYLKRGAYDEGTVVEITRGTTRLTARVTATPLASSG